MEMLGDNTITIRGDDSWYYSTSVLKVLASRAVGY